MSGSPFQIPGLGHAKPNEHLPTESFAPDLLAAAASICGEDGLVDGTNATQWARQVRSKEEEEKAAAAAAAAEKAQLEHAKEDRLEGKKEDAMDVDKPEEPSTQSEQQTSGDAAPAAVDQSINRAGEGTEMVLEGGGGDAGTAAGDHAAPSQDVAHALEAALDGLLSASTAQNGEANTAENGEAITAEGGEAQNGEDGGEHPEWEADSSPYESSSDSSSSDSSSDDDSEDEGGYKPLGIEETARLLMGEADGDGDGDGGGKGGKGGGAGQIRTKNEVPEDVLPKPDVTITEEMKIAPLGVVAAVVDRTVVIKSKTPGEVQVLNLGSVLCRGDRTVIGALAETLGSVRSPSYTVGFATEEEIKELELVVGTEVFYSVDHAQYVFTQALKEIKGSDASNLHDEEVAADEMEFSDDEKEAEYKKQLKAKRRGARGGRGGGREQNSHPHPLSQSSQPPPRTNPSGGLNYDEDEDGPYKPLARPQGYGQGPPSLPPKPESGFSQPRGGHGTRGSFKGGRDFRGRGRGGRGDRRQGRGGGGQGGGQNRFGYDGATESPRPTSYGVPQPPQNPHLPPPPYGAVAPPPHAAAPNPWPTAPASYVPPPPPVSYAHGQSPPQPGPPTAAAFNYNYQAWSQNQSQPYQYPPQPPPPQQQQPHHHPHPHHQPATQQSSTSGYQVPPNWPGVGAPAAPPAQPPPTGTYVNPAFFGGQQGQQAQPAQTQHAQTQHAQAQQYWAQQPPGGYGQAPK